MVVQIDRLGKRLLRCGVCRQRCLEVHDIRREREWRDLSMRKLPLKLRYRPRRVRCPRCGVRVEGFPWAEPWARVTTALSNAVARLARELSWRGTARQYGLNWKSVATIVKRAVRYGLKHRRRPPVHVIGIDEVSRRKGQVGGLQHAAEGLAVGRTGSDRRGSASSSPRRWAGGAAVLSGSYACSCGRHTPTWCGPMRRRRLRGILPTL